MGPPEGTCIAGFRSNSHLSFGLSAVPGKYGLPLNGVAFTQIWEGNGFKTTCISWNNAGEWPQDLCVPSERRHGIKQAIILGNQIRIQRRTRAEIAWHPVIGE